LFLRFVLNTKSEIREQIEKKIKTCEDEIKKQEVNIFVFFLLLKMSRSFI